MPQRLWKGDDFSAPSPASPGGILNYDVSASHTKGKTNTSGLLELGVSVAGVQPKLVFWRQI